MKKSRFISKSEELRFKKIQELKVYKQRSRRNNRFIQHTPLNDEFFFNYGKRFQSALSKLFISKSFIDKKYVYQNINAPKNCTFQDNFDETILFIKKVASSLIYTYKDIFVDFSNCHITNLAPMFLIQIFVFENQEFIQMYNTGSYTQIDRELKIAPSKSLKVNKILNALNLINGIPNKELSAGDIYLPLGIKIGVKARRLIYENKKGAVCGAITKFVDESLMGVKYSLNPTGRFYLDSIIAEVLGNAEDHSHINRWYVNGVSFRTSEDSMVIVELNLCIVNFGYSIYEGFEDNKNENADIYQKLNDAYNKYRENNKNSGFTGQSLPKESMFTIFALQEGISRLKFQNQSRGNGTMNFIRAFFELGILGDEIPKYKPELSFFSGKTSLNCTNKYKPVNKNGLWVLGLNKERDLIGHQDREYIKYSNEYFPGTILHVTVFLNEDFFRKIAQTNGKGA